MHSLTAITNLDQANCLGIENKEVSSDLVKCTNCHFSFLLFKQLTEGEEVMPQVLAWETLVKTSTVSRKNSTESGMLPMTTLI